MKIEFDVYTFGFSNRPWNDTLQILHTLEIGRLVDIRTLPGSRHTPQYNIEQLQTALPLEGIDYIHLKTLGGLRKPRKDSALNAAWRHAGFRGYADYMQTEEFAAGLAELMRLLEERVTVYCCTEAVFWRCHRQLISDALSVDSRILRRPHLQRGQSREAPAHRVCENRR
jgi:uncharacterized protein (DUF488 family)